MGKLNAAVQLNCELGGVAHVCYFSTEEIEDIVNKKGNKETLSMNGQIFPYIAHYLTTGDLIYPAHEGENYITSLLEEMGRVNLVSKLFPHQRNLKSIRSTSHPPSHKISKETSENDSPAKLRIRTREKRWVSKAVSRLLNFPKSTDPKISQVYRPPSQNNKGTTLVVVRSSLHGNNQIKVYGPSAALKLLIPDALTITTQPIHHHLNSQLEPSGSSAHSIVMDLEDQGFVVTVRSSRVEGKTGALITQWLLYRGSGKKLLATSATSPRKVGYLGKGLGPPKNASRSHSTSKKKINYRRPFLFGSDASKYKLQVEKGKTEKTFDILDTNHEIITINKSNSQMYLGSHSNDSFTSSKYSASTTDSQTSSSSHSQSMSAVSSQLAETSQNRGSLHQDTPSKEMKPTERLSSGSFHETDTPSVNVTSRNSNGSFGSVKDIFSMVNSTNLTLERKSYSTASIATKPKKKLKDSTSLLNICSSSPIKKMLTKMLK